MKNNSWGLRVYLGESKKVKESLQTDDNSQRSLITVTLSVLKLTRVGFRGM